MIRSALGKVAWVGRTASMVFGLALVMALVFGAASVALAGNLDPLKIGSLKNVATKTTQLVGKVVSGEALVVKNPSGGSALGLSVGDPLADPATKAVAPMKVDSQAKVENLNADQLDGLDSTEFARALHNHDDRYYTEGEVNTALSGKANTNHQHSTTIRPFSGYVGSNIAGSSSAWVFAGPSTQVTLSTGQRITGSAVGVLALSSGTAAQPVNVGLCYQPSSGGAISNFVGLNDTRTIVGDRRDTISAAASVAPAAGTYNVGFCVHNVGPAALTNNDYVNGWVMVTNN